MMVQGISPVLIWAINVAYKWGAFRLYRNQRTGFAKPFGNLSKAVRISNIIRHII